MEECLGVMIPLAGVILSLSIPIVAIIMVFMTVMNKKKQDKEVRKLIIEAKLLIDEPKKAPKPGTIDVGNLRFACMLLGVGLGAAIDWLADVSTKSIYFWLIVSFGVGIGMLCSFLVELRLAKKQHPTEDNWKEE